jgi:hypothetical protein
MKTVIEFSIQVLAVISIQGLIYFLCPKIFVNLL